MNLSYYNLAALLSLVLVFLTAQTLQAQTLQYTTESETNFQMMGALSKLVGKKPVESTTYVNANYMRSDDGDKGSSIINLLEEKMITLDHKGKVYYEMTFDDMMSMLSSSSETFQQNAETNADTQTSMDFDFSVTELEESETILGYQADRKLMKLEVLFTGETTDESGNTESASFKLHTLADLWVSEEAAGHEVMQAFGQNYMEQMGAAYSEGGRLSGLQQAFQGDERFGPAMTRMQEEMQKVQGVTLKSTMYMIQVPDGMELDVDAVLNQETAEKKKSGALGRVARGALRNRGINIGKKDDEQTANVNVQQSVLLEMTTLYKSFETIDDDPSLFTIPAGYKKVEMPMGAGSSN
jgi:hypothetical protein